MLYLVIVLFLLCSTKATKKGFDISQCESALGMQNGFIEDFDLTASSSMDIRRRGPANARIRTEKGDGAWCPNASISFDSYEYLEIDLRQLKVIKLVETQGRFENGQGTEHAEQYRLEYQREDGGTWFRYKNKRRYEVIQGNSNTYIAEMRELKPIVIARRIRFVPVSSHSRNVCLRVELYGCSFPDGVVSYELPQGHRYGPDVDLADSFYDGTTVEGRLRGGLGLLTDGDEGQANFQLDESEAGVRSHQWIGWKNDSLSSSNADPVSIVFGFDSVRNFSMLYVRSNNMFSKSVRVFRLARLYFGADGKSFDGGRQPAAVKYSYARDNQAEYARTVKIPLEHNIGLYVKLELFFEAQWIMISEINFESESVESDVIGNDGGSEQHSIGGHVTSSSSSSSTSSYLTRTSGYFETKHENDTNRLSYSFLPLNTPPPSPKSNDVIYANDWTKKSFHAENSSPASSLSGTTTVWNEDEPKIGGLDHGTMMVVIGVLAVLLLVLCFALVLIVYRRHKLTCLPGSCGPTKSSAILKNPPSSLSISRPSSLIYPSTYLIHPTSCFSSSSSASYHHPAFPVPSSYTIGHSSNDPVSQSTAASDLLVSSPTAAAAVTSPYATIDLPDERTPAADTQSDGPYGVYATSASLHLLQTGPGTTGNIPRDSLKFLRSLGEGQYGEVYVCEVLDASCAVADGRFGCGGLLPVDERSSLPRRETVVCVKVLERDASELKRSLFEREVRRLSRLQDPNVASMLTCYVDQQPFCVVVEYSRFGDLKSFLRSKGSEQTRTPGCDTLSCSYGSLVFMASQIASGMRYFEDRGLVHRDLSARNCVVCDRLTVKISDLGIGHRQYPEDYSTCVGQVPLPVRWMAWESILLGSFTIKSDVWAFGVCVWEILTLAAELPYSTLTEEEVIENCHNIYCENADAVRLDRPRGCPRELYDLLCNCWVKVDAQRPNFREVHMFLKKKSAGFNPETQTSSSSSSTYGMIGPYLI